MRPASRTFRGTARGEQGSRGDRTVLTGWAPSSWLLPLPCHHISFLWPLGPHCVIERGADLRRLSPMAMQLFQAEADIGKSIDRLVKVACPVDVGVRQQQPLSLFRNGDTLLRLFQHRGRAEQI